MDVLVKMFSHLFSIITVDVIVAFAEAIRKFFDKQSYFSVLPALFVLIVLLIVYVSYAFRLSFSAYGLTVQRSPDPVFSPPPLQSASLHSFCSNCSWHASGDSFAVPTSTTRRRIASNRKPKHANGPCGDTSDEGGYETAND